MKWKIKKSTEKYSRINEFSYKYLDAIYENNFKLGMILIDDGKVDDEILFMIEILVKYRAFHWKVFHSMK